MGVQISIATTQSSVEILQQQTQSRPAMGPSYSTARLLSKETDAMVKVETQPRCPFTGE